MIKTLCLSGGGIHGICYIGAIEYLEINNYLKLTDIDTFVGTSVGSILCFLFNIGYTLKELKQFILEFDFKKLEPHIDSIFFLTNFGIDNGNKIMTIIKIFLFEKFSLNDITFKELFEKTNKKIKILTTNYTKSRSEMFSVDTFPNFSVINAIRMSISIPFFFTPVEFNDSYYIDGGITNNFPIRYCDPNSSLGIIIVTHEDNVLKKSIESLPNYFIGICRLAIDSISLNQICNNDLIINKSEYTYFKISCKQEDSLNFILNKENIETFLSEGTHYAQIFLNYEIPKQVLYEIIDRITL